MGLTAADEIQYACRDEQAAAGDRYPVRQLMKKYDADQKGKQVLRIQVDRDLRRWGIAVRHRKEILRRCADDAGQDEHADLFPPQRCESLRDHDGQRGDDAEAHEAERDRKRRFILQLSDDRIGQSGKEPGAQSGQRLRLDESAGRPQDVEDAGKGVSGEVNGHKVRVGRYAYATADEFGFSPVVHVSDSGESDKRGTSTTLQMSDSPESDNMKPGTSVQVSDSPESDKRAVKGRLDVNSRFAPLEPDEMAAYVALDGQLAARIVLRDVPRKNAKNALARLRELGVGKLSMLTGDKAASARIIAEEVGIDDVHSELFPEDKVRAVKDASEATRRHRTWWDGFTGESRIHQVTMMVGDGVNDAPVLAAADIGMAMTDGTSTAASESAQVVIMNDDIASVPRAIAIARRTKKVMLQAVLVGLGLAVIGMIAAAFNLIPVVVGAFMQEGIDVVSILWALTALWDRE